MERNEKADRIQLIKCFMMVKVKLMSDKDIFVLSWNTWFGQVMRSTGIFRTILQVTANEGYRRGRQKKSWVDNIQEWT